MAKKIKDELIEYVKSIKSKTDIGMDKHLCDHILWIIEEYYENFKKVCSKCGHELSEYSILEEGLCNRCSVGIPSR